MNVDRTGVSGLVVSFTTAGGAIYAAKAGRRTKGQERRDDFETITDRLDKEVTRLSGRVDEQETEAAHLRARSAAQESTIRYLASWVRTLVGAVRVAGQEPPPPPEPVPHDVRPYLTDIGV